MLVTCVIVAVTASEVAANVVSNAANAYSVQRSGRNASRIVGAELLGVVLSCHDIVISCRNTW